MSSIHKIEVLKEEIEKLEQGCNSQKELELIKNSLEYNALQLNLNLNKFILEFSKPIKRILYKMKDLLRYKN